MYLDYIGKISINCKITPFHYKEIDIYGDLTLAIKIFWGTYKYLLAFILW